MLWLALLAQIEGGSGWAGAGLLGLILSWLLLKHLPEKDRQIEKLLEQFHALIDRHRHEDSELRRLESDRCREANKVIADGLLENTRATRDLARETRSLASSTEQFLTQRDTHDRRHPVDPVRDVDAVRPPTTAPK